MAEKTLQNTPLRAANVAWLLCEIFEIATYLHERQLCLGEIRPQHIEVLNARIVRKNNENIFIVLQNKLMVFLHRKYFHDSLCFKVGISNRALKKLALGYAPQGSKEFLLDIIDTAVTEILASEDLWGRRVGNTGYSSIDLFRMHFSDRITLVPVDAKSLAQKTKAGDFLHEKSHPLGC